ncbi:MAG: LapA family protein [Steroidobacterales bacterium]
MSFVRWVVGLAVFASLLLLALQNAESVTLHLYDGVGWQTPLIFLLLVVFAAGAIAGLLTGAMRSARLKRQLTHLRQQQRRAPATHPADGA